jgi:hypothetical protein
VAFYIITLVILKDHAVHDLGDKLEGKSEYGEPKLEAKQES